MIFCTILHILQNFAQFCTMSTRCVTSSPKSLASQSRGWCQVWDQHRFKSPWIFRCQNVDAADIVISQNIDADDAEKLCRSAEEFQERCALCSLASRWDCVEYFYHGVDGNYSDDGDGGDKAKDDGDIIIVSKQRLVKRPLVTEWCLDEDSGEELPLVQNLETYSALQRL